MAAQKEKRKKRKETESWILNLECELLNSFDLLFPFTVYGFQNNLAPTSASILTTSGANVNASSAGMLTYIYIFFWYAPAIIPSPLNPARVSAGYGVQKNVSNTSGVVSGVSTSQSWNRNFLLSFLFFLTMINFCLSSDYQPAEPRWMTRTRGSRSSWSRTKKMFLPGGTQRRCCWPKTVGSTSAEASTWVEVSRAILPSSGQIFIFFWNDWLLFILMASQSVWYVWYC